MKRKTKKKNKSYIQKAIFIHRSDPNGFKEKWAQKTKQLERKDKKKTKYSSEFNLFLANEQNFNEYNV